MLNVSLLIDQYRHPLPTKDLWPTSSYFEGLIKKKMKTQDKNENPLQKSHKKQEKEEGFTEDLAWASASPKGDGYDVAVKDPVERYAP